eukprot:4484035-Amphidinium_carterae.1
MELEPSNNHKAQRRGCVACVACGLDISSRCMFCELLPRPCTGRCAQTLSSSCMACFTWQTCKACLKQASEMEGFKWQCKSPASRH